MYVRGFVCVCVCVCVCANPVSITIMNDIVVT